VNQQVGMLREPSQLLQEVVAVIPRLLETSDIPTLCREAVELAVGRLGFECMTVRLVDESAGGERLQTCFCRRVADGVHVEAAESPLSAAPAAVRRALGRAEPEPASAARSGDDAIDCPACGRSRVTARIEEGGRIVGVITADHAPDRPGAVDRVESLNLFTAMFAQVLRLRRLEARQAQSEAQCHSVIQAQNEWILRFRPEGTITFVNEAYCRWHDCGPEDLVGRDLFATMSPQEAARLREHLTMLTPESPTREIEHESVRPDGEVAWQHWSDRGLFSERGELIEVQGVGREVTGRKRVEAALRASEERYRRLVEHSPDGILVHREGMILFVNRAMAEMVGAASAADLCGRSIMDLVAPESREIVKRRLKALAADEVYQPPEEERLLRLDGTSVEAEVIGTRCEFEGAAAVQVVARDVTERNRSRRKLEMTESALSALLHNLPSTILYVMSGGRRFISSSIREVLGYDPQMFVDDLMAFRQLIHPDDRKRCAPQFKRWRESGTDRPLTVELRVRRADGAYLWLEDRIAAVTSPKGDRLEVGAMIDITDRKTNERELQRLSETQRLLLRELDHRVRNNLTSLMGLIDISRQGTDDVHVLAKSIRGRVEALARIHTMLSRSMERTVEMSELIQSLLPPGRLGRIDADGEPVEVASEQAAALAMILHELMTNSLKYGSLGRPEGRVDVRWTCRETRECVRRVELRWTERDGPRIDAEPSPGTGTGIIEGFAKSELRGEATFSYPPDGADHRFVLHFDPPTVASGLRA